MKLLPFRRDKRDSERRHGRRSYDLDELFARVRRIEIVLGFIAGASGINLLKAFV